MHVRGAHRQPVGVPFDKPKREPERVAVIFAECVTVREPIGQPKRGAVTVSDRVAVTVAVDFADRVAVRGSVGEPVCVAVSIAEHEPFGLAQRKPVDVAQHEPIGLAVVVSFDKPFTLAFDQSLGEAVAGTK